MNSTQLDLRKKIVLDITKQLNLDTTKAEVVVVMDRSASMDWLYNNGTVQDTLERLVPVSLQFDDNGEMDFFMFHNTYYQGDSIAKDNVASVLNKAVRAYPSNGTSYAPIMNAIVQKYGGSLGKVEKAGLLGKLFGQKDKVTESSGPRDLPVYVVFITDGECGDKPQAKEAIINASNYGIFWQFVGIGRDSFSFLKNLDTMGGRFIDNANFFQLPDIANVSDQSLYNSLLAEFPTWLKEAKSKNLIK